jgi:hypothetical protein
MRLSTKTVPFATFAWLSERITAGAQAARALPFLFILTARAYSFLYANQNLDDTISRLKAFDFFIAPPSGAIPSTHKGPYTV